MSEIKDEIHLNVLSLTDLQPHIILQRALARLLSVPCTDSYRVA